MNRAFKLLSRLALCVVLILNCVALNTAAVSAATYTVTAEAPSSAKVGSTITVNVKLSALKTYGGNFTMSYDSTKLSLVSAEKGALADAQGLTLSVNGSYTDSSVRASWAKGSNITASGYVAVCKLKCIDDGDAQISFDEGNVFSADGTATVPTLTGCTIAIEEGSLEESTETTTQDLTETTTETVDGVAIALSTPEKCRTTSTIDVDVMLAQDSLAYGGNVVIGYDSTLFTLSDCTVGDAFGENAVVSVNKTYADDKVKLSWADNKEYTEAVKLATLRFTANGYEGEAKFTIPQCILSDGYGKTIAATVVNADTVITDTYTNDDFDVLSIGVTPVKFVNDDVNLWTLDTSKVEGVTLARSASIEDNGKTTVTANITGPGSLKFDWAVSCEDYEDTAEFDYITFCVDGEEVARLAGEKDVTNVQLDITAGEHTITWVYQKDEDGSDGEDCAWFGNVDYTAEGATLVGDADNNGVVDVRDAVAIINFVENGVEVANPTAADTDNDNEITEKDAARILKLVAGVVSEL